MAMGEAVWVGDEEQDWVQLAAQWTAVRMRAGRLHRLADTLTASADEWDIIIAERRSHLN